MSRRNMPLALIVMSEGTSDAGLVASLVADLGFEARHHQDAGSALEAVEYDHPALVVHGWGLPDMDAVTFHGAVRQRAGGASIPTLAIAPDRESAERVAGAASAGEVMVRPLLRKEVALRLERLVAGTGAEKPETVLQEPVRQEPARRKPARLPKKEPVAERPVSLSRPDTGASGLRLHVIGLGEWGVRGAELFDRQGLPARGVDWAAGVDRSSLPEGRRHRVAAAGDHAAASRAMADDPSLSEALRADADAELFVVIANLGAGAGSLAAALLARIADLAPRAGRLAVTLLPGLRSDPEDRALALVALNSILYGPPTGILLVQPADVPETDADATAPLRRLLELWAMSAGAGPEPIQTLSASGLGRLLAVPGFLGWRETELTADDIAPDGRGWHELVKATPWQPPGFAWSEAQGAIPIARLPWAWHDTGGRLQFERFVQAAWDEAAPCALVPALYAADPAVAVLVSAGMPYPHGLLSLRDSVEADRALLAEKRRKAKAPIPLGEDFLPSGLDMLVAPVPAAPPAPGPTPTMERPARRPPEPAPEPEPWRAPAPEAAWAPEPEHAVEAWPEAPAAVEIPELEAGPMPAAYESALGLVRRIFSAEDLGAEVDLGEVRYVLYDLLEVLREEPHAILPEVFRPEPEEWFERHHVNVAVLAILTGDVLKGSLSEVIDIGTAALLHDLGMLPTRDSWDVGVKLHPAAFEQVIRQHPDTGFHGLQEIPKMTVTIARMVLQEHERMEGSGYPEGLVGDAIDPGARILAVCDTLEALSHPRPYRDHLSPGDALARTQMLSQHTLDPMVVNALCGELTGLLRRGAREPERR